MNDSDALPDSVIRAAARAELARRGAQSMAEREAQSSALLALRHDLCRLLPPIPGPSGFAFAHPEFHFDEPSLIALGDRIAAGETTAADDALLAQFSAGPLAVMGMTASAYISMMSGIYSDV